MDVYFSDQVNDPTLRLFSSTKRFDSDTLDDAQFDDEIMNSTAAAAIAAAAAASAAAANAHSQQKIKNELIHGHSGGSMLDISDIIEDHLGSGDSKLDQFKREIVLSQFSNVSERSNSNSRKEKNNNNNNNNNNNSNNNNNISANTNGNINNNGNCYREKEKQLIESLSHSPSTVHLSSATSNTASADTSSVNSSPTSHVSSTNGAVPKMTNGPSSHANFNALLAAATSTQNGSTLNSNSSAISSTDRDTDYDDYPNDRDSMYEGGTTNLKNLNQKLLHQMNEHHNIDQQPVVWARLIAKGESVTNLRVSAAGVNCLEAESHLGECPLVCENKGRQGEMRFQEYLVNRVECSLCERKVAQNVHAMPMPARFLFIRLRGEFINRCRCRSRDA
ncbi:hypothetical protein RP20_CCG019187 [Aedes albopictus]|nr:hypothetical protein RP20_CCG019187 [Aedes albopictus]